MFSRLLLSLSTVQALTLTDKLAPVTFDQNRPAFCEGIKCEPVECPKAFTWASAQDSGTCCPVCTNAELQEKALPKKDMPVPFEGHVGLHEQAHENCYGQMTPDGFVVAQEVSCPKLECEEKEFVEGRCCESCKASKHKTISEDADAPSMPAPQ